ncbi:MAG: hypothetical protein DDT27_01621 [Dehalococcoidia bacterium]|nr:hypothetical protein [Chloroflexota bacterium]
MSPSRRSSPHIGTSAVWRPTLSLQSRTGKGSPRGSRRSSRRRRGVIFPPTPLSSLSWQSRPSSSHGPAIGRLTTATQRVSLTTWGQRSTSRRWSSATWGRTPAQASARRGISPPASRSWKATTCSTPRERMWWPASAAPNRSPSLPGKCRGRTPRSRRPAVN